jgi:hypothetical protein
VDRYRKMSRKSVLMLVQNSVGMRWIPVPINMQSDKKPG